MSPRERKRTHRDPEKKTTRQSGEVGVTLPSQGVARVATGREERGMEHPLHPGSGLSDSRTVRRWISVVLSHPFVVVCYGRPRQLTQFKIPGLTLFEMKDGSLAVLRVTLPTF